MIANAPKYLTAPKLHMCRGSQSSYKEAEQSWRWSYSPWKMESEFEGLSGRKNSSKCLSLEVRASQPYLDGMMFLKPVSLPENN